MSTRTCALKDASKCSDLIYDIGMHRGEDTDFYLKKGFRVVGFEADPDLVARCRERFSTALKEERLVVVAGAIVDRERIQAGQDIVRFHRNDENSLFGSVDGAWAESHRRGSSTTMIQVPTVDLGACLARYGIPHYMKIDIEGMDGACLAYLQEFDEKPDYVSIEAEIIDSAKSRSEITRFVRLGYSTFMAVQQSNVEEQSLPNPSQEGLDVQHRFEPGSSGAFGRDLTEPWKSEDAILAEFKHIIAYRRAFGVSSPLCRTTLGRKVAWRLLRTLGRRPPGWYDLHARHESVSNNQ